MSAMLRVVAFDLDDTLTESKSKIDQHMAGLLGELLARLDVALLRAACSSRLRLRCFSISMLRLGSWLICTSDRPAARY